MMVVEGQDTAAPRPARLCQAPAIFDAAVFQRFARLPRTVVWPLGFFVVFAMMSDNPDFMAITELEWVRKDGKSGLIRSWLGDFSMGCGLAAALINLHSVLRPCTGALALLQGATETAAGNTGDATASRPMITVKAKRSLMTMTGAAVVFAVCQLIIAAGVVAMGAVSIGIWWILALAWTLPAWILSLYFAATLGAARVDSISRSIGDLDVTSCSDAEWESTVRQPAIALAHDVLPALSSWGFAIGAMFLGLPGKTLCNVPEAMLGRDTMLSFDLKFFAPIPVLVTLWPAGVSSQCNRLLVSLKYFPQLGLLFCLTVLCSGPAE
eukprot:COSAG04_NODE_1667_length_6004_cov_3.397290_3_plen_324_part_00